MAQTFSTIEEYLNGLPTDRRAIIERLRSLFQNHLPEGFQEELSYNMIGYVVPHSLYPEGYHANPKLPLPFLHLASQKNHIAMYHSGLYADPQLMDWFAKAYEKAVPTKLNMGKSCIRFKNPKSIPFDLIAQLAEKMTPEQWIETYEKNRGR